MFRDLGPYHIVQRIGKGGMGEVFLAEDTRRPSDHPHFRLALKLLWHGVDGDNAGILEAERQGAQIQARLYALDNRVARVYDYGDLEDHFYIAMELIDGRDLAEQLREGPVAPLVGLHVAAEIADLLVRAHSMRFYQQRQDVLGVVHGDIKPRNIRIDARGRVRLLDFGIAKALSMTRRLTRNEFGSVSYSSPERLRNGEVDVHSDLWSLAVVLYESLAGVRPFVAENTQKVERRIQSGQPPPPLPPSLPEPLRALVARALDPVLTHRFSDALSFKKALLEVNQQLQPAAVLEPHSGRGAGTPASPAEKSSPSAPAPTAAEVSMAEISLGGVSMELPGAPAPEGSSGPAGDPALAATVRVEHVTISGSERPVGAQAAPLSEPLPSEHTRRTVRPDPLHPPQVTTPGLEVAPEDTRATTLEPLPSIREVGTTLEPEPVSQTRRTRPTPTVVVVAEPVSSEASVTIGDALESAPSDSEVAVWPDDTPEVVPAADSTAVVRSRAWLWWGLLALLGLAALGTAAVVYLAERDVEHQVQGVIGEIDSRSLGCDDAFLRARAVQSRSLLGNRPMELEDALVRLCEEEVQLVIGRYHADVPGLYKSDWEKANQATRHLLELRYSARAAAWELYTRGHVARIEDRYDEALSFYNQAAELDAFCDPYLALMQMFAYSKTKDLAGFQEASLAAEARGCPAQKKHEIWLADLRFNEAEKRYKEIKSYDGSDRLKGEVQEISTLYILACETFKKYITVGNARKKARTCDQQLRRLDLALALLEPTPAPTPPVRYQSRPWWGR